MSSSNATVASCMTTPSTSTAPELKSGADWLACAPHAVQTDFLDGLGEGALMALPYLFEFWAMPHQVPPEGALVGETIEQVREVMVFGDSGILA